MNTPWQKIIENLSERAIREDEQKLIENQRKRTDFLKEMHAHMFDKASAYTNLIIVAGYAGSFALWSLIKIHLTKTESFIVALLLCVSVTIFVMWEVCKMVVTSQINKGLYDVYIAPIDKFEEVLNRQIGRENEMKIRLYWLWNYVLMGAIGTGLLASVVLIASFLCHLYNLALYGY